MTRPRHRPLRCGFLAALFAIAVLPTGAAADPAAPDSGELSTRLGELSTPELRAASAAEQATAVSLPARGPASLLRDGRSLVVEVRVTSGTRDRVDGLEAAGAEILHVSTDLRTVTAAVPLAALRTVGAAPGVQAVSEVLTPITAATGGGQGSAINTCTGSVTSEADTQLRAAVARAQFDLDGSGVRIGVLSDSYDRDTADSKSAAEDVASGDLPGAGNPCGRSDPVQIVDDSAPDPPSSPLSDEGRAMMQLIHDLAPGSQLAFATAFTGEIAFADNIRRLADAGADVIVDDVTYFAEPMYQDGPVAQAVNEVTAEGVVYYSSAANNNIISGGNDVGSWEAPAFRAGNCTPLAGTQCMDFDPGGGVDPSYEITVPAGRDVLLDLQWSQPQGGVTTDLDALLVDAGDAVVASATGNSVTGQKPVEVFSYENGTGSTQTIRLFIQRDTAAGDSSSPRVKLSLLHNGGQSVVPATYTTSAGGDVVGPTIFGHNGAASAVTTAAVPFNDSATVETFSSRGPVTHLFGPVTGPGPAPALGTPSVLAKPDLAATDGGLTTFFGGGNRFYGTSAAAPHAAAVAALQLEANPAQSVDQIKQAQRSTAVPVGPFGPLAAGSGLVDAVGAVGANPPAPPTVSVPSTGPVANPTPSLAFSTGGEIKTLSCSIDGGAAVGCFSPFRPSVALVDGVHTLEVTAGDHFGRIVRGSGAFEIDTAGPTTRFTKKPKNKSFKRKARFRFSTEPGAEFRCALDRKAFKPCTSPFKKRVKRGRHKFRVFAVDALGNEGRLVGDRWKVRKR